MKKKKSMSQQLASDLDAVKDHINNGTPLPKGFRNVEVYGPITGDELAERIAKSNAEGVCFISGKPLIMPSIMGKVAWHKYCNDPNTPVSVKYGVDMAVLVCQKFVQMPYLAKEVLLGESRNLVLI